MKTIQNLCVFICLAMIAASCNSIDYKKTSSGLIYKIYPGKGKDSLLQPGHVAKFHLVRKLNDSVLYSSYGKMPAYMAMPKNMPAEHSPIEVLPLMRKGDSAVTVEIVDTLINRKANGLPPFAKPGDRIHTTLKIIEVFTVDSIARADYAMEMERDRPRQMKEQEEQMEKMRKLQEEQQAQEDEELRKSGEIDRALNEIKEYLAKRNIQAEMTGKGTFVQIHEQGSGAKAENGKFLQVKYTGKVLATDSTFESNQYMFQLGKGAAIRGWDEGLLLFREGGKGTLYIPGFLAYGRNQDQRAPFKPFEALKFDVELLKVSDEPIVATPAQ